MKTMKLLPLKIAVTSAMIIGLGAASTANAQSRDRSLEDIQDSISKLVQDDIDTLKQDQQKMNKYLLLNQLANTLITDELNNNVIKNTNSIEALGDEIGWLENDIADLEEGVEELTKNQNTLIEKDEEHDRLIAQNQADIKTLENNVVEELFNLSDRLIDQEADIAKNNASIEELYDFDNEVAERIGEIHAYTEEVNKTLENLITNSVKNTDNIDKNKADIQALESNVEEGLLELSGHLIDQKADLTKDIKALESNVEEGLLELSGHLIDQKADLTKDIKALESNVEEGLLDLSGRLLDQKADIAKNQADIAQNQTDIQDLAAYNELQDQYAQKQTEAIDALNKASSENTQNIEDLAAYNELQDAYAKQQTEAIDALNKASSENTQNIAKNQADIANNINNIYELAQQQDQHSSDIKTLAKASAANTDRIAKNKADADASFETLTKNQNTLIEKDKEHDKLITANKTAIDANKASADTKFAATADAITKNGNAITKNAKSITDLGTKVDGFDSRVTALDTKVNAFDGRITALDSKVENGMAAQAALSGLFQPYSVGKFNATAALGGYGSKSAVAIGAGYRVNPNLAFKAGAAINTSGNKKGSYNIGVNYEF
ncbi:YadA-like family protein [Moraxella catarrhalis]|uniref:YadA-like family protein n=2 Tax=Moraxella catarrhalis TaxID=480 RepID=UPI00128D73B9|nr:YadA-like family protein [Moraxella catarrhalis]MPX79254.1 cell surface protein [Moraxella catarrhalis]